MASTDLNREVALFDNETGPDRVKELCPGDHSAPRVCKGGEDRGPPPADRNELIVALQDYAPPVKREGAEMYDGGRLHNRTFVQ